ncbi:MAG TPA: tRNA (N6-threonylcarbamoyladenosine(37)-N6)-methyltransferase TrmO [Mariniphaga anaerophila]|uniref:tRNA (N6-threonylcarbamoyladenosine(37)-N6)-methyltransferase TrmO n=1 Tax=Mariniphaga anaerophila TaxID=1484053 RepID=A0A831PIJ1_9BACT|nr:tRNA (N6-threonylcarbamoyladenosine(37)-N6)-methyltransferase TrmO [Mariniphaga anaerophila]
MKEIKYKPIGIIHSPFKDPKGTPIQPAAGKNAEGIIELFPEFVEGLKDLDGFSHLFLLYHFHLIGEAKLKVKPFMDDNEHGIFAIRGPARPNPIGLSVTRLIRIEGNKLYIRGVDIVDGTPLLDIKPYVPEFDSKEKVRTGWLEKNVNKLPNAKDDRRFSK